MTSNTHPGSSHKALPSSSYRPPSVRTQYTDDESSSGQQPGRQRSHDRLYDDFLSEVKDDNLRKAIVNARESIVRRWLANELGKATDDNLESFRKRLSTKDQVSKVAGEIVKQNVRLGDRITSAQVEDQLHEHPEILQFFIEMAFDEHTRKQEHNERRQREEINRLIKAQKRHENYYQILNIDDDAAQRDVIRARRDIMMHIHPDKCKDEAANDCMALINDATELLIDQRRRKAYDRNLANKPQSKSNDVETYGEDFAPGAFNKHNSDSDEEIYSDDEGKREADIPSIPRDVKEIHQELGPHIKSYFSSLDHEDKSSLKLIKKRNRRIKKNNEDSGRDKELYSVDPEILRALRDHQLRISNSVANETSDDKRARSELKALLQMYDKTAKQKKNQWPEGWVDFLEEPLHRRHDNIDWNESEDAQNAGRDDDDGSHYSDSDTSMSSASRPVSPSYLPPKSLQLSPVRPLQVLRKGYTLLGDRILAYRVYRGYSKIMDQEIIRGFKFLLETDNPSLFKVVKGAEIGDQAAHAYHHLPDDEKYDVAESLTLLGTTQPGRFVQITRVGWAETLNGTLDRFPETWIGIEMQDRANEVKEHFIHRTAFRRLMSHADKMIDHFCVDNAIEPPWANTPYPDPSNNYRYMALEYPPPRYRQLQTYKSPMTLVASRRGRQEPMTDNYQNGTVMGTQDNQVLSNLLQQMTLMVEETREERRTFMSLLGQRLN